MENRISEAGSLAMFDLAFFIFLSTLSYPSRDLSPDVVTCRQNYLYYLEKGGEGEERSSAGRILPLPRPTKTKD